MAVINKKIIALIGIISSLSCVYAQTTHNIDSLLMVLDQTIEKSHIYIQKREDRIKILKNQLKTTKLNTLQEYDLNNQLFKEYKPYICDSALYYQNRNVEIAIFLKDTRKEYNSKLQVAYIMGTTGMYKEAVDLLATINEKLLPRDMLVYLPQSI